MANLKNEIIEILCKRTGKVEQSIRNDISKLRQKHASLPINCVAHLYAQQHGFSVLQKLNKEEKLALPHTEIDKSKIKISAKEIKPREKILELIKYETDDYFIKGHINEVNLAYTKRCYTSTFVLARKIIENLIIDLLRNKYPPNTIQNKSLYYDISRKKYHDFSIVLKNLYDKKNDFDIDNDKIIERLYQKTKNMKDDANDKAHSWFHLVKTKSEIDEMDLQSIIELIKKLQKEINK